MRIPTAIQDPNRKSEIYCWWKSPNVAARAVPMYVHVLLPTYRRT
jgi:hypothetical protein